MMQLRIGQGIDIHQFQSGRKLLLGGVEIPSDRGLIGHSDADALLHAIIDAVLGAVGKEDIGHFFPDSDQKWKNSDSSNLLDHVWTLISSEGWQIVNIDCTIMTEAPKIAPHRLQIRESIAKLLKCKVDQIGVKATTAEHLGALGRGEGLLASCVVLLELKEKAS